LVKKDIQYRGGYYKMNNKTIMVTGCLGTVGIFTINELLKRGYYVIGVDNLSGNPYSRIHYIKSNNNFLFVNNRAYDEHKTDALNRIFKDYNVSAILHLAGKIGVAESFDLEKSDEYINSNVAFTLKMLNYAKLYNIKRFVYASSSSIYGNNQVPSTEDLTPNPESVYGITKYAGEMLLTQYHNLFGLETIALRYYNIFAPIKYYSYKGVVPMFAEKIMSDEPIVLFNNGQQRRQFVPIDNIVHANILALETDNKECFGNVFNITVDDEPIALIDLVNLLYKLLNKTPNYTLKSEKNLGDIDVVWGSSDKAKNYLGYLVQKSMYDGIEEYCRYINNEMRDCG